MNRLRNSSLLHHVAISITVATAGIPFNAALAQSSTATGILAGLGVSAASGSTTLSGSAGSIEAQILLPDGLNAASQIIVKKLPNDKRILLLSSSTNVDLTLSELVNEQLDHQIAAESNFYTQSARDPLKDSQAVVNCSPVVQKPVVKPDLIAASIAPINILGIGGQTLTAADVTGLMSVSKTISPLTLTANDRQLIYSVIEAAGDRQNYIVPSDIRSVDSRHSDIFLKYQNLVTINKKLANDAAADAKSVSANPHQNCTVDQDAVKSILTTGSALIQLLVTPADKSSPSPLISAMETEKLLGGNDVSKVNVLQLAMEQVGGSAITRTGIFYMLPFDYGQSQITAGLVVSYHLTDPTSGSTIIVGSIRCIHNTIKLSSAYAIIKNKKPDDWACKASA